MLLLHTDEKKKVIMQIKTARGKKLRSCNKNVTSKSNDSNFVIGLLNLCNAQASLLVQTKNTADTSQNFLQHSYNFQYKFQKFSQKLSASLLDFSAMLSFSREGRKPTLTQRSFRTVCRKPTIDPRAGTKLSCYVFIPIHTILW